MEISKRLVQKLIQNTDTYKILGKNFFDIETWTEEQIVEFVTYFFRYDYDALKGKYEDSSRLFDMFKALNQKNDILNVFVEENKSYDIVITKKDKVNMYALYLSDSMSEENLFNKVYNFTRLLKEDKKCVFMLDSEDTLNTTQKVLEKFNYNLKFENVYYALHINIIKEENLEDIIKNLNIDK